MIVLAYSGTGTQRDVDIVGLGHNGTETQLDLDTMIALAHYGTDTQ